MIKKTPKTHVLVTRDSYDQFLVLLNSALSLQPDSVVVHDLCSTLFFIDGKNVGSSALLSPVAKSRRNKREKIYRECGLDYRVHQSSRGSTRLLLHIFFKTLFSGGKYSEGALSTLAKYRYSDDERWLGRHGAAINLIDYVDENVVASLKAAILPGDSICVFNGRNSTESNFIRLFENEIIFCEASAKETFFLQKYPPVSKERYVELPVGGGAFTAEVGCKIQDRIKSSLSSLERFNNTSPYAAFFLTTQSEYVFAGAEWLPEGCDWVDQLTAVQAFITVCNEKKLLPVIKPHPNMPARDLERFGGLSALMVEKSQDSFSIAAGSHINVIASSSIGLEFQVANFPWVAMLPFFYEGLFSHKRVKTKAQLAKFFEQPDCNSMPSVDGTNALKVIHYMENGDFQPNERTRPYLSAEYSKVDKYVEKLLGYLRWPIRRWTF